MPETVSRRTKLDALTSLASGHTRDQAVRMMHVSKSNIARAKRKQRLYGDIGGGKKKRGPRAKFTSEIISVLLQTVMKVPDGQLNEYINEIYNRYEVRVSKG